MRLVETPDFRDEWKPEALGQSKALDLYQAADTDVNWTYVSPGAILAPGKRTGRYRTASRQREARGNRGDAGQASAAQTRFHATFTRQRPGRLAPSPVRSENPWRPD